jgi:hypothetical protein
VSEAAVAEAALGLAAVATAAPAVAAVATATQPQSGSWRRKLELQRQGPLIDARQAQLFLSFSCLTCSVPTC